MRRIPYLVGDTKGRDHVEGDLNNGTVITPFPLSNMMRLAWAVRKWNITGGFSCLANTVLAVIDPTVPSPHIVSGTGVYNAAYQDNIIQLLHSNIPDFSGNWVPAVDEADLVNDGNAGFSLGNYGEQALDASSNNYSVTTNTITGNAGTTTWSDNFAYAAGPPLLIANNTFPETFFTAPNFQPGIGIIPGFNINYKVVTGSPPVEYDWSAIVTTTFNPLGATPCGVNMVWDGLTFPIYYTVQFIQPPEIGRTSFVLHFSGSLIATPAEYWPFENRLGQAVYDTSSGAQIADPFG